MRVGAIISIAAGLMLYWIGFNRLMRGIVRAAVGGSVRGTEWSTELMVAGISLTVLSGVVAGLDARRHRSSLVITGIAIVGAVIETWLVA